MTSLYHYNQKSNKWGKRVFFKLLTTTLVNGWVINDDLKHVKSPLLPFLVDLAEDMIAMGRKLTSKKRISKRAGRPSKLSKTMVNIGDHLPIEGPTRRSCTR